ncbi:putative F-box/LRR-repeat/kelch-repeat protein At1g11620 [Neltuma alba]|uniref:putative F-box/LRR-repeat/kelch-repeat protein At1g11620 n=1 Tax=Neltuma alba TaxID=207710 RepID=UPI0010A3C0AF|nr:putative F-box/LRR-repeat/kelch-repeat protein At1g11620 [Prosopis alba]
MKKVVNDNDVPFLSDETILNIFRRLPAKSLIRFQCVCKHWKNLIKSPSFVADHLHHSTHQSPCLLFEPYHRGGPLNLHLLDCEMQARQVPKHPLIDYLKFGRVIGSSNGLLCVDISDDRASHPALLLCNPAIREVRPVPTTSGVITGSIGFGFSPIVNDYKIVRIYVNEMFEKVEVYSVKTGSWKGVELGIFDGLKITSCSFTANGDIFWFGFTLEEEEDEIGYIVGGNGHHVIISFDIAMEVFTLLPMPNLPPESHQNRLTTYENKLAMLSYRGIENSKSSLIDLWVIDLWVMEGWSWTKKYTSNPYPCFLDPMTVWRNEIVCGISTGREMENDEPNTILLNLTTKEVTEFTVGRSHDAHCIFNYVESLVPVGGMKLFAMYV